MRFGYSLLTEQAGPGELVEYAGSAERAGFDFEVCSDHTFPWLVEQGHAPYAWSVLGAASQVTERVELMTYVTCPILRYHPAIVAQKAATLALLTGNRFTLGLGAGESLNEHVIGQGWPPVNVRHEMLVEAIQIISGLLGGGYLDFEGDHFRTDSAKVWDLPDQRVPLLSAVSGEQSIRLLAPLSDGMIAVEPKDQLCTSWESHAREPDQRKVGQIPISWGPDRDAAIRRAHEQFRWFAGGWKVNAELPGPAAFAAATRFVRQSDVADSIPCGPDTGQIVEAVSAFWKAGFTDVALVQIGGDQQREFFGYARDELLPTLRAAAPDSS